MHAGNRIFHLSGIINLTFSRAGAGIHHL